MSRNTKQPIQFYRGTTAQHSGYTGPAGECTVDTTKNTLVVHDGVKAGGYPLVKEDHTVTGDGYVLANGSRSTTIGSRTLALSLDTAALKNLLADPSGTDAVAGNLKLSDAVDSSLDAATGGTAATPKAVKTAVDGAVKKTYVVKGDTYIKVDGKFSTTLDDADGLDLTLDTAALKSAIAEQIDNSLRRGSVIGEIRWFAMSTPPEGWLVCNGAAVSRTDYANLFAAIGTLYGAGDGSTTFNLPDARDRVLQGASGTYSAGSYIAAGLPNITGKLSAAPRFVVDTRVDSVYARTGAFSYADSESWISDISTEKANSYSWHCIELDASRSSSIYGNSSTVQPPALCLLPCIRYE